MSRSPKKYCTFSLKRGGKLVFPLGTTIPPLGFHEKYWVEANHLPPHNSGRTEFNKSRVAPVPPPPTMDSAAADPAVTARTMEERDLQYWRPPWPWVSP